MQDRELAHDQLSEITSSLQVTPETRETAKQIAKRTEYEYPVNRASHVIAAGSLYIAGYESKEYLTQLEVSRACGATRDSIRSCYREILEYYECEVLENLSESCYSE